MELMTTDESMTYVGRKSCGCVTMLVLDTPERRPEAAREVAKVIRLGEKLEHLTSDEVRKMPWKCDEHRSARRTDGSNGGE